ncbi:MAG: DUF4433 domain-containing protein [Actinomycetota bacterium]|nr:DUF4433 domain-containing protein [Actinomycetota bacterium]
MAHGEEGPLASRPRDWYVWHFTHVDNVASIAAAGALYAANSVTPNVDVANQEVKNRRNAQEVDPDDEYPRNVVVSDHVPFYIAAKSPMLFVVSRRQGDPRGNSKELVFFGIRMSDLIESGMIWCASDRNAAAGTVQFSRSVDDLGTFVDFDLLKQRYWNGTTDDADRPSRRAAEILVLGEVPLTLVSAVVTKIDSTLARAKSALATVSGTRQYQVLSDFIY